MTESATALELEEYRELRATIRQRGSLRVVLFVVTIGLWAMAAVLVGTFISLPMASLAPLLILAAGFEAVHQLHLGAERIGRYLYVRYESGASARMWEGAIAAFGAGHRSSIRPAGALFPFVFTAAVVVTFLLAVLGGTQAELLGIGAAHALVIARIWMAHRAAAPQRAEDQARFDAVLK